MGGIISLVYRGYPVVVDNKETRDLLEQRDDVFFVPKELWGRYEGLLLSMINTPESAHRVSLVVSELLDYAPAKYLKGE
jgi:hypothetical protein